MKVRVVKNEKDGVKYTDLTVGNLYRVIGIEEDDFRLMSDEGRPYLFPHELFEVVDPTEPDDWLTDYGDDGARTSYAPELNEPGFFEDYFDNDSTATSVLRRYLAGLFRGSSDQ